MIISFSSIMIGLFILLYYGIIYGAIIMSLIVIILK